MSKVKLDFGMGKEFGGFQTHLRDSFNPES